MGTAGRWEVAVGAVPYLSCTKHCICQLKPKWPHLPSFKLFWLVHHCSLSPKVPSDYLESWDSYAARGFAEPQCTCVC